VKNLDDNKDKKNNLTPYVFVPSNSISKIWSSKNKNLMNKVQIKLQVEILSSKATSIKSNEHSSNKFSKFKVHLQNMELHQSHYKSVWESAMSSFKSS
jgi:hypothetical protein